MPVQLPTILVTGIGDSIMSAITNGVISGGPWFGAAVAALQAAHPPYYFVVDDVAQSGTPTSQHWTVQVPVTVSNTPAKTLLKFAAWFPWSPNDGSTGAIIQSAYDTYLPGFVTLCHAQGFIPVLGTNYPCINIATSADDNVRLSVNNQVRSLASMTPGSEILVADFDPVMSNGASPARIIPAYTDAGIHPYTPAGQAAMAPVLQNTLAAYLAAKGY